MLRQSLPESYFAVYVFLSKNCDSASHLCRFTQPAFMLKHQLPHLFLDQFAIGNSAAALPRGHHFRVVMRPTRWASVLNLLPSVAFSD